MRSANVGGAGGAGGGAGGGEPGGAGALQAMRSLTKVPAVYDAIVMRYLESLCPEHRLQDLSFPAMICFN